MSFLSWIVLGLIAGALGKLIMPGDDPGGIFVTILIGIAGAFIGGLIATQLGMGSVTGAFNLGSVVIATGGAVLLLFGYRQIKKKKG
ncbi:MAG: GlsB/YeaQ/YmgE family stress response membrane protein [Gammaproteobacteria bacterium]|nr:GlsB/YeaQ/YmgE family stress response membrane protein [Gammaproteobacteria bacterium]NNF67499.1 GlsB/YeaQ/YmgE family stress response membrane protein [Gammaproteobacteria bacterium]